MKRDEDICDVLIVGLGPTGAVLANLLGKAGRKVVAVERDEDIYYAPRAVHFDDEVMRVFQAAGLDEDIARTSEPFREMEFLLQPGGKPILRTNIGSQDGRYGHPGAYWFHQPTLEKHFRDGLTRFRGVAVHVGTEVKSLIDRGDHIAVETLSRGVAKTFRARYVVGCDGGRSLVRKQADLPLGTADFDEAWVVVDTKTRTGQKHPDLPRNHQQICDPRQPVTYVPLAGPHYEWQFMVVGDRSERDATDPQRVREQLRQFVDLDTVDIVRIAYYKFHALWATNWRRGRLILAGDSAHQMPPFLGQGMCSGIRDAVSLAWRLDLILAGQADQHVLDDYEQERLTHVRHIIEGAMFLGRTIQTRSRVVAWLRNWLVFRPAEALPPLKRIVYQQANRKRPLETGFRLAGTPCAGELAPQPRVKRPDGQEVLLDTVLGDGFALVVRWGASRTSAALARLAAAVPLCRIELGTDVHSHELDAWLDAHAVDFFLLRPDRYVFAGGRLADLSEVVDAVVSRICLASTQKEAA